MTQTPDDGSAQMTDEEKVAASKILVVDDNAQNLELLVAYLDSLGCGIATAVDGLGALEEVRDNPPDLVVNTHFLPAAFLGGEIDAGRLHVPQIVTVTDIRMHRFWYAENVDHWFVPTEWNVEALRRWGVEPHRITVSGIPIHERWTRPLDRSQVLADWELPGDRPIVLLSGGTEFVCGPVVEIARRIVRECDGAFAVVLAGRNEELLAALAKLPEAGRDLKGVAFTDRVHELVEVCSLMATKAGGITTAECLAKGTPMLFLRPVPGQEAGNAEYFQSKGAGAIAANTDELIAHARRLLASGEELERMSQAARRLYRPARETIVQAIRSAVNARC